MQAGLGRPPWLLQPEVFVRGGVQVLAMTVGAGVAGVGTGGGVGVANAEREVGFSVGGPLVVAAIC